MFASPEKRNSIKQIFENKESYATVLMALIIDNYTMEALEWDPITMRAELSEDFNINLPDINSDKISAMTGLLTTDTFYNDWLVFNNTCEVFDSDPFDARILDIITPEQMAWGIAEAALNEDPEDMPKFAQEVLIFQGKVLEEHGITKVPPILKGAVMSPDAGFVGDEFDEDPEMFLGIYEKQKSDMDYITEYVKSNLNELISQINLAPLQSRDKEAWTSFIAKKAQ